MALRKVTFEWDDRYGDCYECGNPAAYVLPDISRDGDTVMRTRTYRPEMLRCSTCAALAAHNGEGRVVWLYEEDEDPMIVEWTVADRKDN